MSDNEFDAILNSQFTVKPEPSTKASSPDFESILSDAIKNIFPVVSTVKEAYDKVEPIARPIVNAPVTGIGGLINLAQPGGNLASAAEGIRQGKTAGSYTAQAVQSLSPDSAVAKYGGLGLGAVTDTGIMTGAVEGIMNPPGPKLRINMVPKPAPENPGLMRPGEIPGEIVSEGPSTTPVTVASAQPEVPVAPKPAPIVESQKPSLEAQDLRSMWADVAKEQSGTPVNVTAPYVRPDIFQPEAAAPSFSKILDEALSATKPSDNWNDPFKAWDDIKALVKKYENDPKYANSDPYRQMARVANDHLDELPEDTQSYLFNHPAVDFETGELQRVGMASEGMYAEPNNVHGGHIVNIEDHMNALKAKEPALAGSEAGSVRIPSAEDVKTATDAYSKKFDISGQYSEIAGLKAERFGNLQEQAFNNELAFKKIEGSLTPDESLAMHFIAEGKSPIAADLKGTEVAKLIENPTPEMLRALDEYKPWSAAQKAALEAHVPGFNAIENHVPHILDYPTQFQGAKVGKMTGASPFVKGRVFENLGQAMDMGYKLKYNKFTDTLRAYANANAKAVADRQFSTLVTKMRDPNGQPYAIPKKVMNAAGEMVQNKDLPAVVRNGGDISPLFADHYLTPDMYKQLEFMKGMPAPGNIARAYDATSAALKKAMLSLSFFHHITLTESGIASGLNPIKVVQRLKDSFKVGGAVFSNPELTRDALKHDLVLGGVRDVQHGLIKNLAEKVDVAIKAMGDKLTQDGIKGPVVEALLKPVAKLEDIWDRALWTHYHPVLKLMAYEQNVAVALANPKNASVPIDVLKRQVADQVNNAFGGQPWELIFEQPQMQQAFHRALLALDWTASNIRVMNGLFEKGVKGDMSRKYWMKLALLFLGSTEMLNYTNRLVQEGEGKFTWNNDPNHKFDIWLYKDKQGMNHYLTINKGFVEPFRWMIDPVKELRNKLNPLIGATIEQMSGHTLAGYDLDFARPGNRVKALTDKAKPFSMGNSTFAGLFPVSQGISRTTFKQEAETLLWEKRDAIMSKDKEKLQRVMKDLIELQQTAKNNGLAAGRITSQIQHNINNQVKYEARKGQEKGPTGQYVARLGDIISDQFAKLRKDLGYVK